ncbi:MAG: hypothetical protein ABWK15_07070 [Dissulfuribacterales bacterium]
MISTRLLSAALFWNMAAAILAIRGLTAILTSTSLPATISLGLLATILGLLKARFILDRTAHKAAMRIQTRADGCAFGFFSLKSWGMILAMMASGRLLRLLHIPFEVIGTIYCTIAVALLISSRIFWQNYREKL